MIVVGTLARSFAVSALLVLVGCTTTTTAPSAPPPPAGCAADSACAGPTPLCDVQTKACVALPPGNEIGYRDGTSSSVTFTLIYKTGPAAKPSDLAFNPQHPGELWVVGYGDDSTHVGTGVDGDAAKWKRAVDPAAMHFMHKPPALAMTDAGLFGICGDNDNSQNGPSNLFMGPALFSMDPAIFAKPTPGGLGSHVDMLHSSPMCKGIAHVTANKFWVFNDYDKALDLYDFQKPHQPGGDDHSDGRTYRYAAGKVKGASDGTPSHVFYDADDKYLYVADTGNARVVRLDTSKGKKGGDLPRITEPLDDEGMMTSTDVEVVVAAETLQKPSGLEINGGLIYVTDAATSMFHVFDKTGKMIRSLATDLPPGSLSGFTFGADAKIWFVDRVGGRVLRIDTQ